MHINITHLYLTYSFFFRSFDLSHAVTKLFVGLVHVVPFLTHRPVRPSPVSRFPFPISRRPSPATMGVLSLFCQIYDLDTIDTRFTTPSSVPYKAVVDARARDDVTAAAAASKERAARWDAGKPAIATTPSKWRTPEFIAYFVILTFAIPVMLYIPYDASRCTYETSSCCVH